MKKYLLDTNTLYYIAYIDTTRTDIDISKLKEFVNNNDCYCSAFSFFEILNNNKLTEDNKLKVINTLKSYNIIVMDNYNFNAQLNTEKIKLTQTDIRYYDELRYKFAPVVITNYTEMISFFINIYIYCSYIFYIDFYIKNDSERDYAIKHFQKIQSKIIKHINKVLKDKLIYLINNNNFQEKNIKKLIIKLLSNIMPYYFEWIYYAKNLSKEFIYVYKSIRFFKKLKNQILHDSFDEENSNINYEDLNLCKYFMEFLNQVDPNNEQKHQNNILKRLEDLIQTDQEQNNLFEYNWLNKQLIRIFFKNGKLNPNDIVDYKIISELYYTRTNTFEYDAILSFDDNIYKILTSDNCQKFKNSIILIDSFKK